jgi:ribosomal protein S18 acetylase RimI-like enzyme
MEYKILKLSELNEEAVHKAVEICVDGFYDIFSVFSKDKNILVELFKDSFDYDMTYVCLCNNEAVGFLGIANSVKRAANKMRETTFEKLFGKKGKMMFKFSTPGLLKPRLKFDNVIEIDYLATASHFKGKGVATHLLEFVFNNFNYEYCELVVFSKNPNAIRLYEKVGFKQINVVIDLIPMFMGLGKKIIMKRKIK